MRKIFFSLISFLSKNKLRNKYPDNFSTLLFLKILSNKQKKPLSNIATFE